MRLALLRRFSVGVLAACCAFACEDDGGTSVDSHVSDEGFEDDELDAGDDCAAGFHATRLYTEPGCDPTPPQRSVCSPDTWDASLTLLCGCDGEMSAAVVFGSSETWAHGSTEPFSDADPDLGCEATTPSEAGPIDELDGAIDDEVDPRDGGPEDLPEAGIEPCPSGWQRSPLYTTPGCNAEREPELVCTPEVWDGGCMLTCLCDGTTGCGRVWGSPEEWSYGAGAPFTECTDGGP